MKKLLAFLLILAACSSGGGGNDGPPPSPARIAYVTQQGNIEVVEPDTGTVLALTTDGRASRLYTQPTWSPDGSRLAFVRSGPVGSEPGIQAGDAGFARVGLEAQAGTSAVHIVTIETGEVAIVDTPFPPFYLYWSPDATKIAMLGNDVEFGRQGLLLLDVSAGSASRLDSGQPYFFAWSPDSDRLLVHAENRVLYYLDVDGSRTDLSDEPGPFSAPHWAGDAQLYPVANGDQQALSLFDNDGDVLRRVATIPAAVALGLSGDGERIAYIPVGEEANPLVLGPLLVETNGETVEITDEAAAFFWSPSGEQLLYLTEAAATDSFALRWNVWDGETITTFQPFVPTGTFFQAYFPFFGQYANSLTFFAPDDAAFTFTGSIEGRGEGVWVQDIEPGAPARLVASGVFSTWSPR